MSAENLKWTNRMGFVSDFVSMLTISRFVFECDPFSTLRSSSLEVDAEAACSRRWKTNRFVPIRFFLIHQMCALHRSDYLCHSILLRNACPLAENMLLTPKIDMTYLSAVIIIRTADIEIEKKKKLAFCLILFRLFSQC